MKITKHQLPKAYQPKRLTKTAINKWRAVFSVRNPRKAAKRQAKEKSHANN